MRSFVLIQLKTGEWRSLRIEPIFFLFLLQYILKQLVILLQEGLTTSVQEGRKREIHSGARAIELSSWSFHGLSWGEILSAHFSHQIIDKRVRRGKQGQGKKQDPNWAELSTRADMTGMDKERKVASSKVTDQAVFSEFLLALPKDKDDNREEETGKKNRKKVSL